MSERQIRRAQLSQARLQEKIRRSRGPADQVSIVFDTVRREIASDQDAVWRDNRWRRLQQHLEQFLTELQKT